MFGSLSVTVYTLYVVICLTLQFVNIYSYEIVEEDSQIELALEKLRERNEASPFLGVDCEGESLSRTGELVILSVATEHQTYLFNINKLGAGVFDKGLRDLLEDPKREKLMFDCRQDSDCLWHQFKVKLTNVLDLQLLEVGPNSQNIVDVVCHGQTGQP